MKENNSRAPWLHYIIEGEGEDLRGLLEKCLTKERVELLFALGSVYVNLERVFETRKLCLGDYVRIHPEPRRFPVDRVDWSQRLVHEDPEFLVINKPGGIPVHATVDNALENVSAEIQRSKGTGPLFITHRLDIPTSGLFVLAKSKRFQTRFNKAIHEGRVRKIYRAILENRVEPGNYTHYMEDQPRAPKKVSDVEGIPFSKRCELNVKSCERMELGWEVEIELVTGRTHQIRAQMGFLKAPIVNDSLYGAQGSSDSLPLACVELDFMGFQFKKPWKPEAVF